MTCTKCHTEFKWGDVLQMDIESCTWVHESCPQDVYNVDDMRSIAAHYATYIRDQGNQTVDLNNYHGKGCDAVAEAFGKAVGTTEKVTHKTEYARRPVNQHAVRQ